VRRYQGSPSWTCLGRGVLIAVRQRHVNHGLDPIVPFIRPLQGCVVRGPGVSGEVRVEAERLARLFAEVGVNGA
jgi:hypothetical protein